MKVECPVCKAAQDVDPCAIPGPEAKGICRNCGTAFLIDRESGSLRWEKSDSGPEGETNEVYFPAADFGPSVLSRSQEGEEKRDYAALTVVAVALVALVIVAFSAFRNFDSGFVSNPIDSLGRAVKNLEEMVREKIEGPKRPVPPRIRRIRDSQRHVSRGYKFYKKGELEPALEEYAKALEIDARNAEAYFWRGRTYIKGGRYDEAMVEFKEAVSIRPNYSDAHDNLGWLYSRKGEDDRGIEHLTRSIELKPENGWTYYNRGRMYFRKGEREKALQDAKRACDLGFKDGCKVYEQYKGRGTTTQ